MNIAPGRGLPREYPPEPGSPAQARSNLVMMGRQDFTSVLLRLIGMELYKLRRRIMSKVLSSISILAILLVFVVILLLLLVTLRNTTALEGPQVTAAADPLLPPLSLYIAVQVIRNLGPILIIILVGTIVGGEYGTGTIRLMFTRGPSRTQFFLSKISAAIICIALGVLVMVSVGMLAGLLLNIFTGVTPNFAFFSAAWLGHAALYLLAAMLNLFMYAMMALFLSTLGRATAAGVAGALAWSFFEPVVGGILVVIGRFARNPFGNFLSTLPDYSISSNIGALLDNQNQYLFFGSSSDGSSPVILPDWHALLVLGVYLLLFIGLAWWVNERRDITN